MVHKWKLTTHEDEIPDTALQELENIREPSGAWLLANSQSMGMPTNHIHWWVSGFRVW